MKDTGQSFFELSLKGLEDFLRRFIKVQKIHQLPAMACKNSMFLGMI